MRILKHSANGFRNLRVPEFNPSEGINLICGDNGEGKTNLAESLWLLTGCQSFRTKRLGELIAHGGDCAQIAARVLSAEREQSITIELGSRRQAQLNGIPLSSPHALLGTFPAVFFSPDTLALVREGAKHRRRFLDIAISLQKPAYAAALSKYCKALAQRNALLRGGFADSSALGLWDAQLAQHGARLVAERAAYSQKLSGLCAQVYANISGGAEGMSLNYSPCVPADGKLEQALLELLRRSAEQDLRWQYTTAGVHKEDFSLRLDGRDAKTYGSRGQLRCCALAIKLAEAILLRDCLDESPVVILDDVMSELDAARQAALLEYLRGWQCFVTCCELPAVFSGTGAALFRMKSGVLTG
ncbi:MAG: DNA replication/repair protein RecF [Clostridium sp.]|jgi:DNA replication and repair protein RecF|nr:DNA replication/repair protein RecF [Clostridium sp.]